MVICLDVPSKKANLKTQEKKPINSFTKKPNFSILQEIKEIKYNLILNCNFPWIPINARHLNDII